MESREMNEITSKDIVACALIKRYDLSRVEPFMLSSEEEKKLFNVLLEIGDKTDIVKIKELSGLNGSYITDICSLSTDISFGKKLISQSDIDNFVDSKYRKVIELYARKGEIGKIQQAIAKMQGKRKDIWQEYLDETSEYREIAKTGMLGFSTGLAGLDQMTFGMMRGHIWVVGAYYGYGKTYAMVNFVNSALNQKKKVSVFSLEMKATQILRRLVALRAGVGLLETYDFKKESVGEAMDYLKLQIDNGNLVIDDEARDSDSIIAKMSTGGFDLVCIDYIQLLSTGKRDQYDALREDMKALQMVTKQTGCTLLLLSQVSNQSQREGDKSNVDGFKGAGDIGQVADVAIKIIRNKDDITGKWTDFFGFNVVKVRHNAGGNLSYKIVFPSGRIVSEEDKNEKEDIEEEVDKIFEGILNEKF